MRLLQRQLDTRAIEMATAVMERFSLHERTCTERYDENKKAFDAIKGLLETRQATTLALHEVNQKQMNRIQLTLAWAAGALGIIGFLATDAGHNVLMFMSRIGEHHP